MCGADRRMILTKRSAMLIGHSGERDRPITSRSQLVVARLDSQAKYLERPRSLKISIESVLNGNLGSLYGPAREASVAS
jgi:hypothetical protein